MKNKLTKTEKKVITAEAVFVFASLIYLFLATAPSQIYPIQGMVISEPDFNIEIENGEQVLISSNENFENVIILGENSEITLLPGTYYWKVKGNLRESEVKTFTIASNVGLDILERPENYELQNSGNVNLNVTKEKGGITSSIVLDKGEFQEIPKDDSQYTGEQK